MGEKAKGLRPLPFQKTPLHPRRHQSLKRVGRGVWGEGRDFKSLALPPQTHHTSKLLAFEEKSVKDKATCASITLIGGLLSRNLGKSEGEPDADL